MDAMFTRWDPVAHLQTEIDQIVYLHACMDEDPGDGSLAWAALGDIARAPLAGHFSRNVRELYELISGSGERTDLPDVQALLDAVRHKNTAVGRDLHESTATACATA